MNDNVVPLRPNVTLLRDLQDRLAAARKTAAAHHRDYMAEFAAAIIAANDAGAGLDAIEAVALQAVADYRTDIFGGAAALVESIRRLYAGREKS